MKANHKHIYKPANIELTIQNVNGGKWLVYMIEKCTICGFEKSKFKTISNEEYAKLVGDTNET